MTYKPEAPRPKNLNKTEPILSFYSRLIQKSQNLEEIATKLDEFKQYNIGRSRFSQNFYLDGRIGTESSVYNPNTNTAVDCILWCINHYLNLNNHPKLIQAAFAAMKEYGTGPGTSAFSCGHTVLHKKVEDRLAKMLGKETCLYFSTGFTANLGSLQALVHKSDLVIVDRECHASILNGIKLSGAKLLPFRHNDLEDLEKKLKRYSKNYSNVFVIVESAYSMSGDLAPLKEIVQLKKETPFYLYVDEAHSFGFYGEKGHGYCAEIGITDQVDFIMTTLSKATAAVGGALACSARYRTLIEFKGNSYMFQASTSPATAAATLEALSIIEQSDDLRAQLHKNNNYMRSQLTLKGFDLRESKSPVIPVHLKANQDAEHTAFELWQKGIFTTAIVYPAVKKEEARLRFIVTAEHTKEQIDKTVDILSRQITP